MTDPKQQAQQYIENKLKAFRAASLGLKLLPDCNQFDFPIEISVSTGIEGRFTLHVRIPWDIKALKQYRKALGPGWKTSNPWTETQHIDSVSRHKRYYKSPEKLPYHKIPYSVSLALDSSLSKTSCRLEQTGIKEIPVHKVVCS